MSNKFAKTIRVITIPPVLVFLLLTLLLKDFSTFYRSLSDYVGAVVFLMMIPALAYPFQKVVPSLRDKGRDMQRKLAFVFSISGYTLGLIYAVASGAEAKLTSIYIGYFCSVIFLTLFNKVLKIHASGHAAGITGPLLYVVWYGEIWLLPLAAMLYFAIIWSSLKMKRHTMPEFMLGTLCSATAFLISIIFSLASV